VVFPSPSPKNIPETTTTPSVEETTKPIDPPNPFNVKMKETSLATAGESFLIFCKVTRKGN